MTENELHQKRTRKTVRRQQRKKDRAKKEQKDPILRLAREVDHLQKVEKGMTDLGTLYTRAEEIHEQRPEIQSLRAQD